VIVKLLHGQRSPLWYALIALVVSNALIVALGVAYTRGQVREAEARIHTEERRSDLRWCRLLVPLDNSYRDSYDKLTVTGRQIADVIHNMRGQFGCDTPRLAPTPTPSHSR
jgi:hypothetical protein